MERTAYYNIPSENCAKNCKNLCFDESIIPFNGKFIPKMNMGE